jgi:hypothetical protein
MVAGLNSSRQKIAHSRERLVDIGTEAVEADSFGQTGLEHDLHRLGPGRRTAANRFEKDYGDRVVPEIGFRLSSSTLSTIERTSS